MKIKLYKKLTKAIKDFSAKEWKEVDLEHYGTTPDWNKNNFVFVARSGKKIIGKINFHIQVDVCTINELLIAKSNRRMGIGKKLLKEVESFVKSKNVHKIYLITGEGWEAEHLYKALGFQKSGLLLKHYMKRNFVQYHKFI